MLVSVALEWGVEQIEIPDREVISFPRGIVGFDESTRFALFELGGALYLLQSVDDPHLGFLLMDPLKLVPDYKVDLPAEDRCLLALGDDEQPELLCVVTLCRDGGPCTANLRAPVALNPVRRLGTQVVPVESQYQVRHPVHLSEDGMPMASGASHGTGVRPAGEAPPAFTAGAG